MFIKLNKGGTPVFPQWLANLKRNLDENPGMGLIPLKSIVIFKQAQRIVELSLGQVQETDQNQLVSIALSEAACTRPIGYQLMMPYTGEGIDLSEGK